MKPIQSAAIVAALGLSLLTGCSDQEAPADREPTTPEESAQGQVPEGQVQYVATMTGIT